MADALIFAAFFFSLSEYPQNLPEVHDERGQETPQRPQEPLRGHPAV